MSHGAKARLRQELLARRRSRTGIAAAGSALAAHAAAEPLLARARRIAVYLSMPTEPPTGPMIEAWLSAGAEVLAPVVTADRLAWVELAPDQPTTLSPLGFAEPDGPHVDLGECDVIVVPALAADHAGHRLGRGAGYYDRALAGVSAPTVAVVFTDELLPQIPFEPHDVPVDAVLTPSGLFRVLRS